MLSSALRGRVHLEFPVFRSRNHLALFTQVLGLLELLKPHLFRPEYTEPLHAMFDTYFQLFKVTQACLQSGTVVCSHHPASYLSVKGVYMRRYLKVSINISYVGRGSVWYSQLPLGDHSPALPAFSDPCVFRPRNCV